MVFSNFLVLKDDSNKTRYETYNSEFLVIVEAFKTKKHYLKSCQYEVLVLTNHKNPWQFMNTKSLRFKQVCLT